MRLRTQFAVLTVTVTIVPVIFIVLFFGFQQAPRDPREPTKLFIGTLSAQWHAGKSLSIEDMTTAAEDAGMPLREVALLSSDGVVLSSTFSHIVQGDQLKLGDLALASRTGSNLAPASGTGKDEPRPELKLVPLDYKRQDSPLVLFDIQPFWSRQDIRNRNILFISALALVLFSVAGIFSLSILRSISRAIKTIEKDTAIVATGNLDHEVTGSGNHEILMLAKSINLMRLNLKDMLMRRSKMLMGISHDLKTPIALIQGYADALADNVADDKENQGKYIEIIRNKAKQLEDLTGELIDFLKIGGDGTISVEEVNLAQLLQSLGERFSSDARLLKRELFWGFGDDAAASPAFPVPSIAMNRPLVERAIENFVTNAFRYSRQNGVIGIRLLRHDGGYAFSITDDGPGIPDEDAPYVFDAFYRGSHSRSDGGHGFGLTIVKAVADLHGWTVSIGKRRDGLEGTEALLIMH